MRRHYWILILLAAMIATRPVIASRQQCSSTDLGQRLSELFGVTIDRGPSEGFRGARFQLSTDRRLSVEEMRKLLVDVARTISEQPELIQSINIALISTPARNVRTGEDVAYSTLQGGILQYFRTEREGEARSLYEISAETWDDAVAYMETGTVADPLCLGQWIVIDSADGSLDILELEETLGAVIEQIKEKYPEAELSTDIVGAPRKYTDAEYEAYHASAARVLHRQWGDFFVRGRSGSMYVQNAHRDGAEISRRALDRYFLPLRRRIVVFAIDPTSYVPPETCLEGTYYISDGKIERSMDRTLVFDGAFESRTFDRFGRREMRRLTNEAEGKK